jgi:uncharacterized membrane protein YkvA (DUF1232 family)
MMTARIRELAKRFKRELKVYRAVLVDPRTPRLSKVFLGLAVGYVAMPFDLIPDFIPVLGQLDDLIIVPGLVYLAVRFLPAGLLAEHRARLAAGNG